MFNEKVSLEGSKDIRCEIHKGYKFRFNGSKPAIPNNSCHIPDKIAYKFVEIDYYKEVFEFAWPAD